MARTQAVKNYKNMLKGFVTEGNEFDEVDGAIRDGLNVEILRTGGTRRRRGIGKETGAVASDLAISATGGGTDWSSSIFEWDKVGGDSSTNFVVVQVGRYLKFYQKGQGSTIIDNYVGALALTAWGSFTDYAHADNYDVKMSAVNGYLFVVGEAFGSSIISWSGSAFSIAAVYHSWRDFQGDLSDPYLFTDSIATRYKPANVAVNTVTGTFTDGEAITGSSGASFTNLKLTGGYMYIQDHPTGSDVPHAGETLTGSSSGATCLVTSPLAEDSPAKYLTDPMMQNLYNQGWDYDKVVTYARSQLYWPTNTQVWFAGKDSSNNFSPTELDKVDFGNSPAPRGKVLLRTDYPTSRAPYDTNTTFATSMPSVIGAYAGRIFTGGYNYGHFSNWIFFSPILQTDPGNGISTSSVAYQAGQCYQKNDPSAEYSNGLLANDGGVIVVPEMGKQISYISIEKAMIVVCDNGVWIITGTTSDTGFTADGYSVDRITDIGTDSSKSIVVVDKEVLYWSDSGIMSISPSDIPGKFKTVNVTQDLLDTWYSALSFESKQNAVGYYDKYGKTVHWAYQSDSTLTNGRYCDAELVLDLKLRAFNPPWVFAKVNADKNLDPFIIGYIQDRTEPNLSGKPVLKPVAKRHYVSGNEILVFFAEYNDSTTFLDWSNWSGGADYSVYVEPWADHVGDPVRDKKPVYVFCYFKKTEDGFEDNGSGGLIAKHQSSCLLTAKYGWHITDAAGKWFGPVQVYRYNRPYVPVDINDTFDTGESVIVTKSRMRGKGKALTLRFVGENGKDFQLLGYAIPYTAVFHP